MKLTIDLGAIAHAIRRTWWALFGITRRGQCFDCGKRLAPAERRYYGHTCERCEGIARVRQDAAL